MENKQYTKEFIESETKKCLENPAYFYNNYWLVNGKKPETITDEEFEKIKEQHSLERETKRTIGLRGAELFNLRLNPLTIKDCL